VRVVWKNLPLSFHSDARLAAMGAMAANEQGKFWEFHDKLFTNQPKIKGPDLTRYAEELGLDMKRFQDAIATEKFKTQIDADSKEADSLGVTGTPAFFVNGKFLSGAKPFEEFAKVINAELQKLNLPIPPGAPKS
jgi:protein-disulfide isomerase